MWKRDITLRATGSLAGLIGIHVKMGWRSCAVGPKHDSHAYFLVSLIVVYVFLLYKWYKYYGMDPSAKDLQDVNTIVEELSHFKVLEVRRPQHPSSFHHSDGATNSPRACSTL